MLCKLSLNSKEGTEKQHIERNREVKLRSSSQPIAKITVYGCN